MPATTEVMDGVATRVRRPVRLPGSSISPLRCLGPRKATRLADLVRRRGLHAMRVERPVRRHPATRPLATRAAHDRSRGWRAGHTRRRGLRATRSEDPSGDAARTPFLRNRAPHVPEGSPGGSASPEGAVDKVAGPRTRVTMPAGSTSPPRSLGDPEESLSRLPPAREPDDDPTHPKARLACRLSPKAAPAVTGPRRSPRRRRTQPKSRLAYEAGPKTHWACQTGPLRRITRCVPEGSLRFRSVPEGSKLSSSPEGEGAAAMRVR
jgi:hypothetical protein